ncbi:MAG: kynureninase [Acidimicrobiia bacterium]|nr:kynureninase [Acidimicrobiia bacterium]
MVLSDLGPYPDVDGFAEARDLDAADPLKGFRSRYVHTDPDLIYLDGNSLGRLPSAAVEIVEDVTVRQWGDRLIRAWNEGWWELQLELGDLLAPIVGAREGEVIISDSTSVNLYKLAMAAVAGRPGRSKIVTDDLNFPTDVYILEGVAEQTGRDLVVVASDGISGPLDSLAAAIDGDTALVSLSHTAFKSGYTYDMAAVTEMAHESGAMVLWDCSHSVGALPIDLTAAKVDLAVGCTYKYLNGGPGSPAFLYVRTELQDSLENPIKAWWGHADPFAFDLDFRPVSGIRRYHTGTMPILSVAPTAAGIRDVAEAGTEAIRAKSVALSEYLIRRFDDHLRPLGFTLGSPEDKAARGSHVSLAHERAWPITRALIELGRVIPDFRMPDNIRLGLSPLYTSFTDVHTAVQRLSTIVQTNAYGQFANDHQTVT